MSFLQTLGYKAENQANKVTDLSTNDNVHYPTTAAVQTAINNYVSGLLEFKGSQDCSADPDYPAASKGDAYYVSAAGKIGGAGGVSVEIGDVFIASADNAGGSQASVGASWFVLEHNLVGAEVTSNKDTDGTMAANSDVKYPSQKAAKTYIDNASSNASVIGKLLTGFSAGAGTVSASDTILQAFNKVVGNIALKLTANSPISGATKTKITYDANGLVTAGADIAASDLPSGIDAAKISAGNVSNTEFDYLDGVTSAIQTQINSKLTANSAITGATKTKITYDANGLITAGADATTSDIGEGSNLYFTAARAIASALTGFSASAGTVSAADTILQAFNKVVGNIGNKQDADADLTAIAGLSPVDNDIIQRKSGAWTNRTPTQFAADINLVPPSNTITLVAASPYTLTVPASMTVAGRDVANTFTRQQFIDGGADEIQLRVQANGTQTANLQTWENSSGGTVASVNSSGWISINRSSPLYPLHIVYNGVSSVYPSGISRALFVDSNASGNADATSDIRALSFSVKGTGTTNISSLAAISGDVWAEMTSGTIGVAIGASINMRISSANTVTNAYAYRATATLSSTGNITSFSGILITSPNISSTGVITNNYGVQISNQGHANVTNAYGLFISSISNAATNNYAIFTNAGLNELNDQLFVDGSADRVQLEVQAHSTQTSNLVNFENSSGTVQLAIAGNGRDFILDATTGSKIGTATSQKLGFWNAAPIVQPTTGVTAATIVGGAGTTVKEDHTFDGYTIAQVVKALRNTGLLA